MPKKPPVPKILLTGPPGCGKTKLVLAVLEELKKDGFDVCGIVSPDIMQRGERIGFNIIDIASGEEKILASIKDGNGPKVGKYRVNVDNVNDIVDIFKKSLHGADVIIIDEIGTMELYSRKFSSMVDEVLASDIPVIAVVHRMQVKRFKDRGELLWVSKNRLDELKRQILDKLMESTSFHKKHEKISPLEHALKILDRYEEGVPVRAIEEED